MKKLFLFTFTVVSSLSVAREDLSLVYLGNVSMGGTGCPNGSLTVDLDRQNESIHLKLDSYFVEASGSTRVDRKSCNIAIPLRLPRGLKVSLVGTRYDGFVSLTQGASAVLTAETFTANTEKKPLTKQWNGPIEKEFSIQHDTKAVSGCGEDIILRINSNLRVTQNGGAAFASVTEPIIQKLKFSRCN